MRFPSDSETEIEHDGCHGIGIGLGLENSLEP
jgi:hypothetical protein